mgnify:CR=1 FL=1
MKSKKPICVIGGVDNLSKSFFKTIRKQRSGSIFINVNDNKVNFKNFYNIKIFELKKMFEILNSNSIEDIIFLGKIKRPNLKNFVNDGEVEKYLPLLYESYKSGDGKVLSVIIDIFLKNNYKVLAPNKVTSDFTFVNDNFSSLNHKSDILDMKKSIKILNTLSKHDNAQSIICVNGYILAIEAAEGTDNLLKRTVQIRKKFNQIKEKLGLLVKIPKSKQSLLIDLPVIGPETVKLVKKVNLNGIALNRKLTLVENKKKTLELIVKYGIKLYNV